MDAYNRRRFEEARDEAIECVEKRHDEHIDDPVMRNFIRDKEDLTDGELEKAYFGIALMRIYQDELSEQYRGFLNKMVDERVDKLTLIARFVEDALAASMDDYSAYYEVPFDEFPDDVNVDIAYKHAIASHIVALRFVDDEERSKLCARIVKSFMMIHECKGRMASQKVSDWITLIMNWMKEHNERFREWMKEQPELPIIERDVEF